MPRAGKTVLLTALFLLGAFLVVWGIRSFVTTEVGGIYIDYADRPGRHVPDIDAWFTRLWHAGIAFSGLVLAWFSVILWLPRKASGE